jgi:transglutaminase-like putative cysteine protease
MSFRVRPRSGERHNTLAENHVKARFTERQRYQVALHITGVRWLAVESHGLYPSFAGETECVASPAPDIEQACLTVDRGPVQQILGGRSPARMERSVEDGFEQSPRIPQQRFERVSHGATSTLQGGSQFRLEQHRWVHLTYRLRGCRVRPSRDDSVVRTDRLPSLCCNRRTGRGRRRATQLTANAQNPYDAASLLQQWLENDKGYSLDVDRPSGNIADAFMFEMDRRYCVYYATAMTVMLRTLRIPARFAVGYTPGQRVADDRWVIRGYDFHAWVDVYFPEIGWIPFDPTPAGPRRETEQTRLEQARAANESSVDTAETQPRAPTATPTPSSEVRTRAPTSNQSRSTPEMNQSHPVTGGRRTDSVPVPRRDDLVAGSSGSVGATSSLEPLNGSEAGASSPGGSLPIPASDRDRLTVLASAVGVALGAYRFGLLERGYEALQLRWQSRTDSPETDAVRAFERLERFLAKRYRDRRVGEPPRAYLAALERQGIDARAHRVGELYERARYAGGVSRAEADGAIELVDDLMKTQGILP